ncbi:MAG: DUF2812 domain-containing protein [Ruminococcus sp.]|nr:DUF2812 domain-containing protein [Ruminococcus sp.]
MAVKKYMPLWFLDVIAAEEKLQKFSAEGLQITDFSPFTGGVTLEEGEKKPIRCRICQGNAVPRGLLSSGWRQVWAGKKFYIAAHDDPQVEAVPDYRGWKTANRLVLLILFFIFCCTFGFCIGAVGGSDGRVLEDFPPLFTSMTILCGISLIASVYFFTVNRKLNKYNKDLNLTGAAGIKTIPEENFIYTKEQEKQMLKSGRMIKKSPLGWFYAPDKAEEMVEKMAAEGWKFYRFNTMGTDFYFVKSDPCKLRFVVDYQHEATDEYFSAALDDGWKLEFTSVVRMGSFIVWSKEYDEERPEFYSDPEDTIKRAKKTALVLGIPMVLFAIFCIIFIIMIFLASADDLPETVAISVLYLILGVEYCAFGSKAIGYYFRIKEKYKDKF